MRKTLRLVSIGLQAARRDAVMLVLLPAPFVVGALFRLLLPLLGRLLTAQTGLSLAPWYPLADGLLLALTPVLLTLSSAFLLLEECDEGIGRYFSITPAGRLRYLAARIGFPALWGFASAVLVVLAFGLSALPLSRVLAGALVGALSGVAVALLVVSLAANRVEGLAASKLSGIALLGLLGAWFLPSPGRWLCAFLPSFWLGEVARGAPLLPALLAGIGVSVLWVLLFVRRFLRKVG